MLRYAKSGCHAPTAATKKRLQWPRANKQLLWDGDAGGCGCSFKLEHNLEPVPAPYSGAVGQLHGVCLCPNPVTLLPRLGASPSVTAAARGPSAERSGNR